MNEIINITKWIFNPFLVKKPGQVKVVVLCIVVATTFWFLNAFNKTYTTTYSYPIHYEYDIEKYVPTNSLKSTVNISLTGQGWDLLKEAFSLEENEIIITPVNLPGKEIISQNIILESTREILSKFEVNKVFADSIYCEFDYKVNKLIKLSLPVDSIRFANGYAITSPIIIDPNEVLITGPSKILDTIQDNYFISLKNEIDDDYDEDIELNFPTGINVEIDEVNVSFETSPYIEIIKKLKYRVINYSDSNLIFNPKTIDIKIYTTEFYKDSITDSLFSCELNLQNLKIKKDTFLHPTISSKIPEYIKKVYLEDSTINISLP